MNLEIKLETYALQELFVLMVDSGCLKMRLLGFFAAFIIVLAGCGGLRKRGALSAF
jgi:hypothetical protein